MCISEKKRKNYRVRNQSHKPHIQQNQIINYIGHFPFNIIHAVNN